MSLDRMKILMVSYSDCASGNASRLLGLASQLARRHEVAILFDGGNPRTGGNALPLSGKHSRLNPRFTPWLGSLYPTLLLGIPLKLLYGFRRYDLVHCFKPLPSSFIPAWLLARLFGARLLLDWDDWEGRGGFADQDPWPLRGFLDWFQGFALRHCDGIVAVTPFLEKEAKKFSPHVFLIANGADLEAFQPSPHLPGTSFKLLFLGHLFKSCDLDLVLHGLKHSIAMGVELLVVGDGPRRAEFEELARQLRVTGKVRFLGFVPRQQIPGLLAEADAVALPLKDNLANKSRFPVKLGEYLAAGKVIIANPVGVVNDFLEDRRNGFLVHDAAEFGQVLDEIVRRPAFNQVVAVHARDTAESRLNWVDLANQLEKVYRLFKQAELK